VEQSDQVVAANQRLAKSHDDVSTAQQNLAEVKTKPSSEAEALSIAMGKLSPSAQAFIGTLEALKPAWQSLKFAVQDSLFGGIGPQLQSLATQYLPVLKNAMSGLAGTMNTAFKDVGAWLSKPETMATIQQIVANIGSSFQVWSQSLVPFSNAFLTITQVGAGFLPSLGKVITDGANAFNNFIQQAAKSGELQQWMRVGIEAVSQLMKMLPVLGKMFLDLAPMAIPFLQTLNILLPSVEPVFRVIGVVAERFFTGFNKFLNTAKQGIGEFWDVLKTLGGVFERVWHNISGVIDKAWKIIKPILDEFKKALSLLNPGDILGKISRFLGDDTTSGTPAAAPSGASPAAPAPSSTGPLSGGSAGAATTGPLYGGAAGSAGAAASASGFDWDAVAKAESSGNWSDADSGHNGHYGGLQFAPDTWAAYGGLEFAARPDLATPEQQKTVANRTAFTGWKGTPPQGLGAWETIGNGSVPGITTSSTPSAMPGASTGTGGSGAAPSFAAPSGLTTAGGDAGLLASVPSGKYVQTQAADLTKGIGDCSSAVEDLINMMDGVSTAGRQMSTGNASQWLTAHGFMPTNAPVPGAFNVGFNDHHMQATLPGGTPFNWGSDAAAGQRGIGGTGAFDPAFTQHYYRPGGALPDMSQYSVSGMPTAASPQGLGTQQSPMYVQNAIPGGQQLGQDFISGIGEIFGIDGSVFKNPLDSGLFKGFKGLMGALTGGGKGSGGGFPASAFQGGGAMGGGGDMLGGLGSMLTGIMPQPFGQVTRGGPAQAPDAFQPMLPGSGGNTGMPSNFLAPTRGETPTGAGHSFDQSINFFGPVGNPQAAGDMATGLNVPRARQGLTGLPRG
jgi:hypothetical protein